MGHLFQMALATNAINVPRGNINRKQVLQMAALFAPRATTPTTTIRMVIRKSLIRAWSVPQVTIKMQRRKTVVQCVTEDGMHHRKNMLFLVKHVQLENIRKQNGITAKSVLWATMLHRMVALHASLVTQA
jgi:hypothetical protein